MNCCICGTIKNCAPYIKKVLQNIELIGSLFNEYKIIIYYDKSNDNTLNILLNYQKTNSKLTIYVNKDPVSNIRTYNISKGRNYCLNYIRNNCIDYEMFIMLDLDGVSCKEINLEIIKKYLNRDDWDSISFNTVPTYYDIWALSIKPYYLSVFAFKDSSKMTSIMSNYITTSLNNLKPGELLQCASAFNGFAIYRTNKFIDCNYDGRMRLDLLPFKTIFNNNNQINSIFEYQKDDCEHRAFHLESIKKHNSKIMISSEIIFK